MVKTVWITGASSGIGKALAKEYFSRGHQVVLSARSKDKLEAFAQELGDEKRTFVVPLDLADPTTFESDTRKVIERFGSIDILVNNGGISQRSIAFETKIDVVKRIFEVNLFGTIALTNDVLKHMKKKKEGQIVVISSLVGKFGTPLRSSYSASKHALHGYFDSLRAELEETIPVTILCPGFVKTDVSINALVGDGSTQGEMDEAQSKAMTPEDFARKAVDKIEGKVQEAYIGGKEVAGVYLKRFLPGIFSKVIRKAKVN